MEQAWIHKFFKGGVEVENFERKMFVDTHKNYTIIQLFLSSSFSRGLSLIFLLCFIALLFLKLKGGGLQPPYPPPPPDPPMQASAQTVHRK